MGRSALSGVIRTDVTGAVDGSLSTVQGRKQGAEQRGGGNGNDELRARAAHWMSVITQLLPRRWTWYWSLAGSEFR